MRLCLDTSAYSQFKRGECQVVEVLDSAGWIGVPTIVLGELRTGFALGHKQSENEKELAEFLRHPVVETLSVDDAATRVYAEIMVLLRRAGTPVPTNDIWIASVAASVGASVVTFDAHFAAIGRVGSIILEAS